MACAARAIITSVDRISRRLSLKGTMIKSVTARRDRVAVTTPGGESITTTSIPFAQLAYLFVEALLWVMQDAKGFLSGCVLTIIN
jgi:DNA invertase Pin-like site-specific DNA recombinase